MHNAYNWLNKNPTLIIIYEETCYQALGITCVLHTLLLKLLGKQAEGEGKGIL